MIGGVGTVASFFFMICVVSAVLSLSGLPDQHFVPQPRLTSLVPTLAVFHSDDDDVILVLNKSGRIDILDIGDLQNPVKRLEIQSRAIVVALSPNGTRMVSGGDDNTVRIWDAETGEPVGEPLQGHEDWVRSVAFSPDGTRIVSGGDDNAVRIWDAETGEPVGEPLQGHEDWVRSVAFSPDGTRIVSGGDDNAVRIWDAETGEAVGEPMHGHEDGVRSAAYSSDERRIISSSDDGTVRIWNAETGQAVGPPLEGIQTAANDEGQ